MRRVPRSFINHAYTDADQARRRRLPAKWLAAVLITTVRIVAGHMRPEHRIAARASLARIYGWFTEGFDTADLKEARKLLSELNGSNPGPM